MTFVGSTGTAGALSPEEAWELSRKVAAELSAIVGERHVDNDPCVMDTYAWQYVAEAATGDNYIMRPLCVVLPGSTEEVAAVVRACGRLGVQYKAMSTGFGFWNGSIDKHIVQIDLKRMDRILRIDPDNMTAVVEPWVTGNQLQTEAMKLSLNTHIAGVGGQASVLASATSMMGQGWDGVSMGCSDRTLLGCEWVTPDGEIVQVGSFDSSGDYFSGDGPGFSLRGAFRGFGGAMGGLGVFTKAAVKLYPWNGPEKLEQTGTSPVYFTEVPKNHASALVLVNDWDDMAELGRRLGESEICDYLARNAPSALTASITLDNNELQKLYTIPLMHEMYYALVITLFGLDKEDLAYRKKVLKGILKDLKGGMLLSGMSLEAALWMGRVFTTLLRRVGIKDFLSSIPGFLRMVWRDVKKLGPRKGLSFLPATMYQAVVRSGMNMRGIFRFGGSFWTAMGALVAWDNAIRGAKVGAVVKKKYIDKKIIFDDGGDNAWGGLYEGGAYAHLEELCCYDPTDDYCKEHVLDYILETNLMCIKHICGDSLNAIGPPNHALYSPVCYEYDRWQQAIKKTLDPDDRAEACFYTDPDFASRPPDDHIARVMNRVMSDVVEIDEVELE